MKKNFKGIGFALLLIIAMSLIWNFIDMQVPEKEILYSDLISDISSEKISRLEIGDSKAKATYKVDKLVLVNCDLFEKYLETFREF